MQAGIQAWTDALTGNKKEVDLSMDTDAPALPTHKPGGEPHVSTSHFYVKFAHEIEDMLTVVSTLNQEFFVIFHTYKRISNEAQIYVFLLGSNISCCSSGGFLGV